MKRIWAALTKPEEAQEATDWLNRIQSKNLLDPEVLTYPATTVIKATDGTKNILHVPVQRVFFVESLGISPLASPLETAQALSGVIGTVRWESLKAGQGELYMGCRDEQTTRFAEHNGFELMTIPIFRMKVKL